MKRGSVKPAALYIVAHTPNRAARQAGQKTAQMYLDRLMQRYHVDTVILCSATLVELDGSRNCASVIRVISFTRMRKIASLVSGLLRGIPPRFATRVRGSIAREITTLIRERTYELVWLEFSQVGWLLPTVLKAGGDAVETVLSLHDIQSQLVSRKSWLERTLFAGWTRAYERNLIVQAGSVRVLSAKDRNLILELCGPRVKVDVMPPVMSDFIGRLERREAVMRPHSLLLWGAMNRTENYSAAVRFARLEFPKVLKRFPESVLFIVGADPPPKLQAIASAHVMVTGFVADPTPFFLQAALGIVPLTEGAGVKLKTLEMLAAGLKVVSTAVGAEGVPASDNLVVTDIHDMAGVIIELFSAADLRMPAGAEF